VQVRVDFTVEPFQEGVLGPHVQAALAQLRARGLTPDAGPFGSSVTGSYSSILPALEPALTAALANGATTIALSVRRVEELSEETSVFLRALEPLVEATGATIVPIERIAPTDTKVHWEGRLVAGLRPARAVSDLKGALDRLIDQVEEEMGNDLAELDRTGKQRAVRLLEERGAFEFRGAVEMIAEVLEVSKVTVYNYLNARRSR
jgi:uncharacterized protein YqgV (UPF0045/DUF77 family)